MTLKVTQLVKRISGNFEDIILSEISWSKKDKYCMSPLIGSIESSLTCGNRKWNGVVRAGGGGNGNLFSGYTVCFIK